MVLLGESLDAMLRPNNCMCQSRETDVQSTEVESKNKPVTQHCQLIFNHYFADMLQQSHATHTSVAMYTCTQPSALVVV